MILVTFVYSQFPIQCVVFSSLVVVRKASWNPNCFHSTCPYTSSYSLAFCSWLASEVLRYFVSPHYNKYHVCFQIHQFLLNCVFNVFAFYQGHHFHLLPINMPLPPCLLSHFYQSYTFTTCTFPSCASIIYTSPFYWRHCCIVYKHWWRVVHLRSKGSSATLEKTFKAIIKKCEACYSWRCFGAQVLS
jgi:hypothetical protein